jgi:hypothetical protein
LPNQPLPAADRQRRLDIHAEDLFMVNGTPINRDWVYVLQNGNIVVEWETGTLQDIQTGDFYSVGEFGHPVQDIELERLKLLGRVDKYDARTVYLRTLPEFKRRTLD